MIMHGPAFGAWIETRKMLLSLLLRLRSVSMKSLRITLLLGIAAAAACVPKRDTPPPLPQEQPVPVQRPRPVPPPPPAPADWRDIPLTPGGWSYRNEDTVSQASFGAANNGASFIVRCDRAARQLVLSRAGITSGNMMTIRTTSGARNFPLSVQSSPLPYVSATLPASDRFLDSIAFSRGRIIVEVPGTPMLVIPSWAEPARVIEDCRG
jgi:hypothetical protein